MTRKELVEQLTANFAEDEEVFVKYDDDQGECVGGIKTIGEVTQNFVNCHFEVFVDGKWIKWQHKNGDHPTYHGYARSKCREVIDREWTATKRCIIVS